MENGYHPSGVPEKFSTSGQVQHFPGNTILAHILPTCPLLVPLCDIYSYIAKHPVSSKLALLPPSSWHMTIIEGVTDSYRNAGNWPQDMKSWPVEKYTEHIIPNLKSLSVTLHDAGLAAPYRMKVVGCQDIVNGVAFRVEPVTAEENSRIRRLRDIIAVEGLGFRHAGHDVYEFHISLAYVLQNLDATERNNLKKELEERLGGVPLEFELGSPEFCLFDNMYNFRRQFYIAPMA